MESLWLESFWQIYVGHVSFPTDKAELVRADNGSPNPYGTPQCTRAEYLFRKLAGESLTKLITDQIQAIVGELKEQIQKEAADKIGPLVLKALGLSR